jgi:hypothetical protein
VESNFIDAMELETFHQIMTDTKSDPSKFPIPTEA